MCILVFFFFNDPATTEISTLSLHDALPICLDELLHGGFAGGAELALVRGGAPADDVADAGEERSEEHTSELQSRQYLVCRLLLEKKQQDLDKHNACRVLLLVNSAGR